MIEATIASPSASTNTGTVVPPRQPDHASTTSPVWSAIHAAPAAASAINSRNRMIRIIDSLWRGFGKRRHGVRRELARGCQRGVARIGFLDPGLSGGTIGRRQGVQFVPRLVEVV